MDKVKTGKIAIILILIIGMIGVWLLEPISQDIKYHLFTDQRTILNIPNFWNVLSNLPFLLVGALGLYSILRLRNIVLVAEMKTAYILFLQECHSSHLAQVIIIYLRVTNHWFGIDYQ